MAKLNAKFALQHLDKPKYFLGIEAKSQKDGSMLLTQAKYIHDLLNQGNMVDSKRIWSTLMIINLKLSKHGTKTIPEYDHYK